MRWLNQIAASLADRPKATALALTLGFAPLGVVAEDAWRPAPTAMSFGDVLSTRSSDADGRIVVPGFLEPYLTVRIASPQAGTVQARPVGEGDTVSVGTLLYQLDDAELRAALAIAEHDASRTSQRDSAATELGIKKRRLKSLESIASAGHSGGEELARAKADVQLAEANLRGAEETAAGLALEVARINTELAKRQITAPVDGIITMLGVECGESVGKPGEAVAVVVQLDRLKATFYVPTSEAMSLNEGDSVPVHVRRGDAQSRRAVGTVDYVAPITDAESATVRVRVVLANTHGQFRSGSACDLVLGTGEKTVSAPPASRRIDVERVATGIGFGGIHGSQRIR